LATLVLVIISFAGCTDDVTSDNQSKVAYREGVDLEELYLTMINSESYITAEEKSNIFFEKLNFTGDITEIDTEARLFLWISSNLSSTHFTSVSEAQSYWEEAKSFRVVSIEENIGFYEAMDGRTNETKDLIIQYDPIIQEIITVPFSDCKEDLDSCIDSATSQFVSDVAVIASSYLGGVNDASVTAAAILLVTETFTTSVGHCANNYVGCVLGAE